MKQLSLILLSLCMVQVSYAQNVGKLIKEADKVFYEEKFDEAFEKYDYIYHLFPEVRAVDYEREISYLLSEGRGKSIDKLVEFGKTLGKQDPYYNFWLGKVYMTTYQFDLAQKHFTLFLKNKSPKSDLIQQDAKNMINQIAEAKPVYEKNSSWVVERLPRPLNNDFSDVSPSFFSGHNELLFLSARPTESLYTEGEFHVFHSFRDQNGDWSEPTYVEEFGVFDILNAKIEVVSHDGKAFVYKDDGGGSLYYAEPTKDNWTSLSEFDANLKRNAIESHFFIDDNETTIIYASENGGQVDLYQTTKNPTTKEWTDAVPVTSINTTFNEDSPYLSHDGKYLYFSSDRPESIGGYDVFRSTWNENKKEWSSPVNMGYPINTIDDDIHFQLNEDNNSGYLSSNRLHSHGDFDIFSFYFDEKRTLSAND